MQLTWVSLVPPLVVIGGVLITNHLNISLFIGILTAALIATQGQVIPAIVLSIQKFTMHFSDSDNIYLYLSLIMISSLITLLTVTGSAAGCARIISEKIRTKRGVGIATIMLSFLMSIDDYLSILTVGFVMKPIADRLAVARAKVAYIAHTLAGPLVIMVPISTWAAAVLAQLDNAGIQLDSPHKIIADSFYVYLKTIPFIFYSILVVISVWFVVLTGMSYGSMAQQEKNTVAVDDVFKINELNKHSLQELLMPIVILMGGVFFGILYSGDYYLFGGTHSFFEAFRHNNKTFLILFFSGLGAFVLSVIVFMRKKMVSAAEIPVIIYEGILLMKSSIVMVIFASILGNFLRLDLHTGSYLASLLLGKASLAFLPVILFFVSLFITLATGSAWGTFSLLIPIATQMLIAFLHLQPPVTLDQITILFPALGAVLSGAACGNHISPFADTTVMTATSTGVGAFEHARTQIGYAIPVLFGTIVSFIVVGLLHDSGLLKSFFLSIGAGMGVMMVLFMVLNHTKKELT
jgi:tetracycline resistance efflux pump